MTKTSEAEKELQRLEAERRREAALLKTRSVRLFGEKGWMLKLADLTGRDIATVKRWANASVGLPAYVTAILDLLEAMPAKRMPKRFAPYLA